MSWFPTFYFEGETIRDGSFWTGRPLDDGDPHRDWLVVYRIEPQNGHPVIAEIRILPWPKTDEEHRWITEAIHFVPAPGTLIDDTGEVTGPACVPPRTPAGGLTARAARRIRTEPALREARKTLEFVLDRPALSRSVPPGYTLSLIHI